ncbi:MAG TPA: hypothetical protein VLW83_15235, partial [Candidatus Acidoferrales bacterium]|nr:hypothetical protein [Candidatus Acidoferrales bacterium]
MNALFARVKFELAPRTLAVLIESRREHGAAVGAARTHNSPNHAGCTRSEEILFRARFGRPLTAVSAFALLVFGIA